MSNPININFNFIKILNEEKTYKLLFPEREIGLAIVLIYEKISDGVFEDEKFYIHYLKKSNPNDCLYFANLYSLEFFKHSINIQILSSVNFDKTS